MTTDDKIQSKRVLIPPMSPALTRYFERLHDLEVAAKAADALSALADSRHAEAVHTAAWTKISPRRLCELQDAAQDAAWRAGEAWRLVAEHRAALGAVEPDTTN